MIRFFHVTSVLNRRSIRAFGLDWTRMGFAPGIAGSRAPEVDGCFMVDSEFDADWFVRMNNTGGPVDVWAIDGIDPDELVQSPNGYSYLPRAVPADQLTLLRQDLPVSDPGSTPW